MRRAVFCLALTANCFAANAQQTVGLFTQAPGSVEGYVLFAPITSNNTYLVDKCGKEIHSWTSSHKPGQSVYLLTDGSLLRPGNVGNPVFTAGGNGGIIERFDWNSNLLWSYTLSGSTQCQHHDICPLPNGNMLVIAWESKTIAEAISAGRNPALTGTSLWTEKIVELQPVGTDSANIVWEWHAWDHLVQEYDNTKNNYNVVADHPELININYYTGMATNSDWLHMNSIAYNPVLDQVMVSLHNFDEIWIIDHSTSTAEAASHSGGAHNIGGDLMYRWGNPVAYNRGTVADRQLFGQHNAHWIEAGLPDSGKIMIFNNGNGRQPANYSSVDIITPPVDAGGSYTIATAQPYQPASAGWSYTAPVPTDFYATNISGAQQLQNGNALICNGPAGTFFEVDTVQNTVWKYVNPISNTGPISQGNPASQNLSFRCSLYTASYPGFASHTLSPGDPLELNPLAYNCSTTGLKSLASQGTIVLNAVNPLDRDLVLQSNGEINAADIRLIDMNGKVCESWPNKTITIGQNILKLSATIPAGIYELNIVNKEMMRNIKLVKNL